MLVYYFLLLNIKHGKDNRSIGDKRIINKIVPENMATTPIRCKNMESLECPSLPLHGPFLVKCFNKKSF